jgi:hypothetical protein
MTIMLFMDARHERAGETIIFVEKPLYWMNCFNVFPNLDIPSRMPSSVALE